MPHLSQSLNKYDLKFLKIIARLWGFDVSFNDKKSAVEQLSQEMTNPQYINHLLSSLSTEAQTALQDLVVHHGRILLSTFTRKYGEIRKVGAAKRDREEIFLNPQNASEMLWFRGIIYQDFFEGEKEIEEFVYIPSDLLALLPISSMVNLPHFTDTLPAQKIITEFSAQDALLDDVCTYLAWLRKDRPSADRLSEVYQHLILTKEHFDHLPVPISLQFLNSLLSDAGLIDSQGSVLPDQTRTLLSSPRLEAISRLYEVYTQSTSINELKQLEHIESVGEWDNNPITARVFLIDQLKALKPDQWYDLDAFIHFIHDTYPDFQRPAGNYEVWLIRRRSDGSFLHGFESWYDVDGELLRYLILAPFFWFGILNLSIHSENPLSYAFRITPIGENLFHNKTSVISLEERKDEEIQVFSSGVISIPRRFPPSIRYQIARFCDWIGIKKDCFLYQITPLSLGKAQQNNLKPQHLIALLQKNSQILPPHVIQAIRRWAIKATEVKIKQLSVIQVRSPEILDRLIKSHCSKYIQQILNPTTAVIIAGHEKDFAEYLLTMGILSEIEISRKPQ